MYRLEVDRKTYVKKALAYYRSLAGGQNKQYLITTMVRNGVLMTPHLCGWYFELPLDDVLKVIEAQTAKGKITPVFGSLDTIACFYLRSDIWNIASEFLKVAKKKSINNTRARISDPIVDTGDIAFYYGISRTVVTKYVLPKTRPKVIVTNNTRQTFYYYDEIVSLEQSQILQNAIKRSRQNYAAYTLDRSDVYKQAKNSKNREATHTDGYREEKIIFRDTECPRYEDCTSFAVITDYMDCSLCIHNTKRKAMGITGVHDPSCVFINPRSKRHLKKIQEVSCFPND